jgi:Pyruvate/2-oxoacid:ferredoxin oxidoreductase delta subunit
MSDEVFSKLAKILDTLPNGFPPTPDGLELKILKKIFTPEEADLFCDLRLTPETAEEIAARTGRPVEGLEEMLTSMCRRGEVAGTELAGVRSFAMMPWIVGIYEFQVDRMDREFCEMLEQYSAYFGPQMIAFGPRFMQTIPIEEQIPSKQEALPYEQVSHLIENGKSFRVTQCICKKERGLMDEPCSKPEAVCMQIGLVPDEKSLNNWGEPISKEEAYRLLRTSEEAGLVHLTSNWETGHWFICNCCGCCCGVLKAINQFGLTDFVNSHFYAEIDPDECNACGICLDDRCQVGAIEETEDSYRVITDRCVGCGLCVTECPTEAIKLVRKPEEDITHPPKDEESWNQERARLRGVDYSLYK